MGTRGVWPPCVVPLALCLACVLDGGVVSAGQGVSLSTGAIDGTVTDATGAALAGVMVALSSEALLQPRSASTGADGGYRFPALPPGDYTLGLTHTGFRSSRREAIRVDVGFTATIDVVMELETLSEQITVVRPSPTIDRTSTTVATTFTAEQLALCRGREACRPSSQRRRPFR